MVNLQASLIAWKNYKSTQMELVKKADGEKEATGHEGGEART